MKQGAIVTHMKSATTREAKMTADDRRYETYEMRAAYDPRYVIDSRNITSKAAAKDAYAEADRIYVEMGRVRQAAKAMDPASEEYAREVATFARMAEQRSEIHARIAAYEQA